ncbi:MAG: hypothetical protein H7A49_07450 [Akkermansiaceae bacterium]|nr:hypothetical protein [Akkermansiaceae bacterium]MCP5546602.1 hypothetical protein [Akkermansiaceae bacterium]
MSDETPSPSEQPESAGETAQPAPKTKRASSPRTKKAAKRAKPVEAGQTAEAPLAPANPPVGDSKPETSAAPEPSASDSAAVDATESTAGDWPEPATSEGGSGGGQKRKRRRKKKSGQQQGEGVPATQGESNEAPRPPRPQHDSDQLAKNAWKIYLAEISEEGVALVGDNDARELARRCFRLAEIFMDEQARRR